MEFNKINIKLTRVTESCTSTPRWRLQVLTPVYSKHFHQNTVPATQHDNSSRLGINFAVITVGPNTWWGMAKVKQLISSSSSHSRHCVTQLAWTEWNIQKYNRNPLRTAHSQGDSTELPKQSTLHLLQRTSTSRSSSEIRIKPQVIFWSSDYLLITCLHDYTAFLTKPE